MLTLPIKSKFFKMIEDGLKFEEYREITHYYESRFKNIFSMYKDSFIPNGFDCHTIRLRNGYSVSSPTIEVVCSLSVGTGKKEWGAEEGKLYYILKIHKKNRIV